ncbi:hypothetical protein TL16_g01576 [Triparma laevis f. inornata]|uniref:EF-hand domain-containing protein n=1 Tax=Triparma laevis f. inornata TaxID=1714386 RepID=A0A9W6ZJM5_9STRA|nr:hypothetical protein TL16_g01576 [Triparma laevis f. inornata]
MSHSNSAASPDDNDEFTLDISDEEIVQVLAAMAMQKPDYLPQADIPSSPSSRPPSASSAPIELNALVSSITSYSSPDNDPTDVFERIKEILIWCMGWWEEREKQEEDAKRQRFKVKPEDLKRVVEFIDQDGSGTISIQEFQEVFSMVKRASAQKATGTDALLCLKKVLSWASQNKKQIDDVLRIFDSSDSGYVTHRNIANAMAVFGVTNPEQVKEAVDALDANKMGKLDTIQLGNLLRKAEGEINLEKIESRRKKVWDDRFREAEKLALEEEKKQEESFSKDELIAVIKFMDPNNDDSIDLEEFIHAFRRARRSKASENVQAEGKELMLELEQFLIDESFTLIKWFNLMDASFRRQHFDDSDSEDEEDAQWYPGGIKPPKVNVHAEEPTGSISALELRKGLTHLGAGFDETEIGLIMRFMDPNSDGELSYPEVKDAFRKLHEKTEAEMLEEKVGGILMRIEDFMKEKGMRILNVFQEMDEDGSGAVTGDELILGLLRLKEPSGKLKALIKRKNEADAEAAALAIEQEKKDEETKASLKKMEDAGVSLVLDHLEQFMKAKGLTVTTLCQSIDSEGTCDVDAEELVAAVEKMMQPSGASRAALKRTREREAARMAASEAKRSKARELMEKMQDMEDSGALNCLTMIEAFMRKSCMRIIDIFSKMDASGDGLVSAEELRAGLKKCGLKMKRKDVVLFVRYVDLDGGGEVGMEELEGAIRELRRFNWEKQTFQKLISTSGAPLPLRCPSLLNLFRPSKNVEGSYMITGDNLCSTLMRMRGDGDDWLWEEWVPPVVQNVEVFSDSRGGSRTGSRGGSRTGSRGGSRPGSRVGGRPGSRGSGLGSRPQSPGLGLGGLEIGSSLTQPSGLSQPSILTEGSLSPGGGLGGLPQSSSTPTLPQITTSKWNPDEWEDGTRIKLKKELRSKVKAKAFKALHIGVPVTYGYNR